VLSLNTKNLAKQKILPMFTVINVYLVNFNYLVKLLYIYFFQMSRDKTIIS